VFVAGLAALTTIGGLTTIGASTARAAASAITLPGDLAFPEGLAASSDGTLFIGSAKMGGVLRVAPGSSTPTSWITPTTFGTRSIFGVLVDEHAGSDEYGARVLRLSPDSHTLEVWVTDPQLADIDGIAFGAEGNLYANTYEGSGLFRIDVKHPSPPKLPFLVVPVPVPLAARPRGHAMGIGPLPPGPD
jgi:sugar lactone lactonase YvrE